MGGTDGCSLSLVGRASFVNAADDFPSATVASGPIEVERLLLQAIPAPSPEKPLHLGSGEVDPGLYETRGQYEEQCRRLRYFATRLTHKRQIYIRYS